MRRTIRPLLLGMSGLVGALVVALAPGCVSDAPAPSSAPSGPDWQRKVVFYELWVRSYQDSDGDGIGDIDGLIQRLDYLRDLGVGALWLMPIHPSPLKDSGYDVADYLDIHPDYGSLEAFDRLVAAAHARNIKIVMDLVLNHTSVAHPWFQESRSNPGGSRGDYYIWASEAGADCTEVLGGFGQERWTRDATRGQYYFHQFFPEQPDLNFRSASVQDALLDVARFWLERGVDGFRLDAAQSYVEDLPACLHRPETHAFHRRLRALLDGYPNRALIGEVAGDPQDVFHYLGNGSDELHLVFYFDAWTAIVGAMSSGNATTLRSAVARGVKLRPAGASFGVFTGNHDLFRISSMLGSDPSALKMAASVELLLPGVPFVYYGEEIGMLAGTAVKVDFRDWARTPMQWDPGAGAGFTTGTPWLPLAGSEPRPNVADQLGQDGSILEHLRRWIAYRNRTPALHEGGFLELPSSDPALFAFLRTHASGDRLVVLNFDRAQDASVSLDLPASWSGTTSLVEELTGERAGEVSGGRFTARIPPRTAWVLRPR